MGKNRIDKKAKFSEPAGAENVAQKSESRGSRGNIIGLGIAVAIVAAIAFVMFGGGPGGVQTVTAEAGMVSIPVADVDDGQAHYYTYNDAAKPIKFFVLKSSDGVIRAAFDACDVCYREKKGYRQEGDIMVCNNCGQRFPSVKINEIRGGCNPAPIERRIDGRNLVMSAQELEQGAFYF